MGCAVVGEEGGSKKLVERGHLQPAMAVKDTVFIRGYIGWEKTFLPSTINDQTNTDKPLNDP